MCKTNESPFIFFFMEKLPLGVSFKGLKLKYRSHNQNEKKKKEPI